MRFFLSSSCTEDAIDAYIVRLQLSTQPICIIRIVWHKFVSVCVFALTLYAIYSRKLLHLLLVCSHHTTVVTPRHVIKGCFFMLIWVFVLTSRDGDMQNFYFRNGFYFCDVAPGTRNYMTPIISGTDYVLYSKLNMSNVSLNIILRDIIAIQQIVYLRSWK